MKVLLTLLILFSAQAFAQDELNQKIMTCSNLAAIEAVIEMQSEMILSDEKAVTREQMRRVLWKAHNNILTIRFIDMDKSDLLAPLHKQVDRELVQVANYKKYEATKAMPILNDIQSSVANVSVILGCK